MALVEGNLLNIAAVRGHRVQVKHALTLVLIQGKIRLP